MYNIQCFCVAPLFMQKRIRIGTAIIAAIVLIIGSYVGIQNIKQTSIIQTFESSLEKMGGVKRQEMIIAYKILILVITFIPLTDLLYGN